MERAIAVDELDGPMSPAQWPAWKNVHEINGARTIMCGRGTQIESLVVDRDGPFFVDPAAQTGGA